MTVIREHGRRELGDLVVRQELTRLCLKLNATATEAADRAVEGKNVGYLRSLRLGLDHSDLPMHRGSMSDLVTRQALFYKFQKIVHGRIQRCENRDILTANQRGRHATVRKCQDIDQQ